MDLYWDARPQSGLEAALAVLASRGRVLARAARQINAWLARGVLRARIQEVLPLSRAREAHQRQEQGELFGKLVLVPGEGE